MVVRANKPDLFVKDDKARTITLIEVGVTSLPKLKEVETTKSRKYDLLARELERMYPGYRARTLAFVMTWDGLVSRHHRRRWQEFGLSEVTRAYTQTIALRLTLESVSKDLGRGREPGTVLESDAIGNGPTPSKKAKLDFCPVEEAGDLNEHETKNRLACLVDSKNT